LSGSNAYVENFDEDDTGTYIYNKSEVLSGNDYSFPTNITLPFVSYCTDFNSDDTGDSTCYFNNLFPNKQFLHRNNSSYSIYAN